MFQIRYYENNWRDIVETKNDLTKLLNDFKLAKTKMENINSLTKEELLSLKEKARENIEIDKIQEIDKKLKELEEVE